MTTGPAMAAALLIAVLHGQEPERLHDTFADAMGRADGCPSPGCTNTQPPDAAVPTEDGWHIHYRCADCGTEWSNAWKEESNMRSEVPGQTPDALENSVPKWDNDRALTPRIWRSAAEGSDRHNLDERP